MASVTVLPSSISPSEVMPRPWGCSPLYESGRTISLELWGRLPSVSSGSMVSASSPVPLVAHAAKSPFAACGSVFTVR